MLKPRPDWSPLGVKFKISDEHPRRFRMGVPPPRASDYNLRLETFVHLPFSFLKYCFSAEERYMQGYCVLRKSAFLSRTALFDCGSANWSCMSRSVKGDKLVCMVSAVKLIPCNLPCMFC